MGSILGSTLVRVVAFCLGALGLYILATFPTRRRLAREHYRMWREERQLAKERAHVRAAIRRVARDAARAGKNAPRPPDSEG